MNRFSSQSLGGGTRDRCIRVVRDDDVRPPNSQGQHELAEQLFGGAVGVHGVPGMHELALIRAGQMLRDRKLPELLARRAAGTTHGGGEAILIARANGRRPTQGLLH